MELIISVSLRRGPGQRANVLEDIVVRDLVAKEPEEVLSEIEEKMEPIVIKGYQQIEAFVNLGGFES